MVNSSVIKCGELEHPRTKSNCEWTIHRCPQVDQQNERGPKPNIFCMVAFLGCHDIGIHGLKKLSSMILSGFVPIITFVSIPTCGNFNQDNKALNETFSLFLRRLKQNRQSSAMIALQRFLRTIIGDIRSDMFRTSPKKHLQLNSSIGQSFPISVVHKKKKSREILQGLVKEVAMKNNGTKTEGFGHSR